MRNSWSHVTETDSIQYHVSAFYCAFSFSYFKCVELFSIFLLPVDGCWTPWCIDTFETVAWTSQTTTTTTKSNSILCSLNFFYTPLRVYILLCEIGKKKSNQLFSLNNGQRKNYKNDCFSSFTWHSPYYTFPLIIYRIWTFIVIDWLYVNYLN